MRWTPAGWWRRRLVEMPAASAWRPRVRGKILRRAWFRPSIPPATRRQFQQLTRNVPEGAAAPVAVPAAVAAVQAELVEMMQQHPQFSVQALTAILISRNLERSGDHATNIAEDVIFWLRGSDVRHKMSLTEAD